MLKITDLHVNYGEFQALNGVSFEINEGEIVTILGSNGAGKSTSINAISGVVNVKSGKLEFEGKNLNDIPTHERVAMGIIQVPEGRKLFPFMSVMDNILIGSYLKNTRNKRKENLDFCFELFPKLHERRNQLAGSLSGGEQQMCAIARALMGCPRLLMLDEPSLGLAPVVVEKIFENLIKINKMGTTILLVEQNATAALEIADRGYAIENGRNVLQGSAKELLANEELRKAYLGL